jgi:uncharacterized protein YdeI (BOF family)
MRIVVSLTALLAMSACAQQVTPINKLTLPATTTVEGTVTKLSKRGFELKDNTGTIFVDTDDKKATKSLKVGDKATVSGVVDEDDSLGKKAPVIKEIDAYSFTVGNKTTTLVPAQ